MLSVLITRFDWAVKVIQHFQDAKMKSDFPLDS